MSVSSETGVTVADTTTVPLLGLALLTALVVAPLGPESMRLPVALAVVCLVPGLALAGFSGGPRNSAWWSMVLGSSLAASALVAAVLASMGELTVGTATIALVVLCAPAFCVQARRRTGRG
jgi:hypothetical protein